MPELKSCCTFAKKQNGHEYSHLYKGFDECAGLSTSDRRTPAVCPSRGWNVLQVFSEKVSGAKKNEERQELQSLMSYISTHNVEKVLVWELSRLGRNTLEVLKTIEEFNTLGISLFIKNYNIETLNEDGKPNVMSQFLVTILAEVASMERASIKERMDSGLKKYMSNGGKVGRKVGYRKNNEKVQEEYSDVIKLLRKGISIRNVSKLTGHSVNTILKCKKQIA